MKLFNRFAIIALIALLASTFSSCKDEELFKEETVDFQKLELQPESNWNGSDGSGSYVFGSASFKNDFNSEWQSWSGFAFSNVTNITTGGLANQYSAYVNGGGNSTNKYAVAYVVGTNASVTFDKEVNLLEASFTNSTYAYLSIINGDAYSKKFEAGDWFKLTIKAFDAADSEKGEVELYLADYRTTPEVVITTWKKVDLKALKGVHKLVFSLSSTDNSDWGMNTPAYFCMDDLVFEYLK